MAFNFDIRTSVRLSLALLLFLVAVGPVCLLMSPSMAMASDIQTDDCGNPAAPGSSTVECPHAAADEIFQAPDRVVQDAAVVPAAVVADAVIVPQAGPLQSHLAILSPPASHPTPLRL